MREEIASDFGPSSLESELESIGLNLLLNLTECFGSSFSFVLSEFPLGRVSWGLLRTARLWMALCWGSGINAGGMGSVGGGGVSGRRAIGGGAGSSG